MAQQALEKTMTMPTPEQRQQFLDFADRLDALIDEITEATNGIGDPDRIPLDLMWYGGKEVRMYVEYARKRLA